MLDVKKYKQADLVLKVNQSYDHDILNLDSWEGFLDILCGVNRGFQKSAIRDAIIYLASGRYKNIQDLVKENYEENQELQAKYTSVNEYEMHLQLPDKLFANIDLATGTGKSYVIYGIAQIMLGLGLVDRVLVLCPSLTIEKGLTEKFIALSGDRNLKETIPEDAQYKNPTITDANVTVKNGDICVENIHSVYERTGSSIDDSFKGEGKRVLVLNDESHHIFNKLGGGTNEAKHINNWKRFLINPDYNFKYILGFTGTAYYGNEYFNDVIYRYSLRQAIDAGVVKNIEYAKDSDSTSLDEKFQIIYDNHKTNAKEYSKIKPLTILVTGDKKKAKRLYAELLHFLKEKEGESAEGKVLIVTSASEHKLNVTKLKTVDEKDNSTEWIISISMLTEGWDVKNVFQIVPWEDRAFNSKLLIAQVLGRGLRIPEAYSLPQPRVTVFNHYSWSASIIALLNEILEDETKITSEIIKTGDRKKYNFDIYNLEHTKEEVEEERKDTPITDDFKIGDENIKLVSQVSKVKKRISYATVVGNLLTRQRSHSIEKRTWKIEKIIDKIYSGFEVIDSESEILQLGKEGYQKYKLPTKEKIKEIILKSMRAVGIRDDEELVEKNAMKILDYFSKLLRDSKKEIKYKQKFKGYTLIPTADMNKENLGIGNFKRDHTLFHTNDWKNEIENEGQKNIIKELINDNDSLKPIAEEKDKFFFKTPLNLVFANKNPEKKFVDFLCEKENAKKIDCWIKSRDRGFYSIEYSLKSGKYNKSNSFNPDFFIKAQYNDMEYILVVEIKADEDDSKENKAKYKYSKEHFERLNEKLKEQGIKQEYIFHFLSPNGYAEFFEYLKNGSLFVGQSNFRCELERLLEKNDADDPLFQDE